MVEKVNCPWSHTCGGCQLLELSYIATLDRKLRFVNQCFKEQGINHRVENIIGASQNTAYRNKMILTFRKINGKLTAGFYEENTHQIVDIKNCLMHSDIQNEIARGIKKVIEELRLQPYDEDRKTGLIRHIVIKEAVQTKEILIVIVTADEMFIARNEFVKRIKALSPYIKTIVQNINPRKTSIVLGEKERVLYGKGYICDELMHIHFPIASKSFYQVHPLQTIQLYQKVKEFANVTKQDRVLDAYSGVGTIGTILANQAKEVICVENNKQSVNMGIRNIKENKIENVHFICDDATNFIQELVIQQIKIDCLIMDPPRSGSTPLFLHSILSLRPKTIVYVSCGPDTLARDVKILCQKEYKILKSCLVDMFCWTKHIETVTLLQRKDIDDRLKVRFELDNLPLVKEETKATYQEIKDYIFNKYNVKVSTLNIAQTKTKYGIIERESYNKPKDDDSRQPKCTREKEEMIVDALKHFKKL